MSADEKKQMIADRDIKKRLQDLPEGPGVYIMKGEKGEVLYIGKARLIRKRVMSYFRRSLPLSPRIEAMVSKVRDIEFMQTASEADALIYEASLVKEYKPRYNVELKDDKAYPLLKLTLNEPYPRLLVIRSKKPDGAMYFGPYTSVKLLRQAMAIMQRAFPLRTCKRLKKGVCLMFHLRQCLGPCEKKVGNKEYKQVLKELLLFLQGRRDTLIRGLSKRMAQASERKQFEEAAKLRDRIHALTVVAPRRGRENISEELASLSEALNLPRAPLKIDAFDISNIFGALAVGSMVQFVDGAPNKSGYRRFRIKFASGIDDYKMMREIIHRRYARCLEEKISFPDLIIIDGGKGHLSAALKELKGMGINFIPVVAIAKEFENVYAPGRRYPVPLPAGSGALAVIQRIRNEAHRFAISYHRAVRRASLLAS